jgi:hypothetical protein
MPIVPFDPLLHGNFVYPYYEAGAREHRSTLNALLRRGMKCVVECGTADPSLCKGFAVASGQTVAFAYVKRKIRSQGRAWRMLEALGVDTNKPMVSLTKTPACDGMRRNGKAIRYPEEVEHDEGSDPSVEATGRGIEQD